LHPDARGPQREEGAAAGRVRRVAFKRLSDAELEVYLATRTWRSCSGAYAIKEEGDPYVRVVAGSESNDIGLPMETTMMALEWIARIPPLTRPPPA
jgi:predicted house-cleaning NTP pyrophosphatase (Maf/HAM1 superfamily)